MRVMHVTHLPKETGDVFGACGAPITPVPDSGKTSLCTKCWLTNNLSPEEDNESTAKA